jgi:single-stranded-DNA-specific exonuclease
MGAKYADFIVPNRFKHGYGLSPEIVKLAIAEKQPDLIITVDNGVSSVQGVEEAKKNNIQVIITDHHLPAEILPKADAIINPNLIDCSFESKNLAGVGVCFYLFSALKTHLVQQKYFSNEAIPVPDLRQVLDLVALGTVADVVKLDQNNRILVAEGLKRIRQKKCAPGILALLELAKRKAETLKASDLGFFVAPRLNAAGRMDDISRGILCLLSEDINDARRYALILDGFNQTRKSEQERVASDAQVIVEQQTKLKNKFALSLFDPSWHEGVVGIVAGKLKELHHRPVAVFAKSGLFLKGSIRSIPSVHIKDLLDLIDREQPNLIDKFGGHAMAAGLSLKPENFRLFETSFAKAISEYLNHQPPHLELLTDGVIDAFEISMKNAELIEQYGPWGQGFEEPIFYNEFEIVEQTVLGGAHLKCRLKIENNPQIFDAIAFFQEKINANYVKIAFKLALNHWRNDTKLQLMIEEIKPTTQ